MVHAATIPLNLKYHWTNIINKYKGRECTHTKITKITDPNGQIIDESETNTTIYGVISPVQQKTINESAGLIQSGDLIAYFLDDEGVIVGEQVTDDSIRFDYIKYEGILYVVNQLQITAYDDGVAIVSSYILRKVAFE